MEACCLVTKLRFPAALDIVGIATEPMSNLDALSSEDAMYFDARQWSSELETEARRLQQQFELLTTAMMLKTHEMEYPDVDRSGRRIKPRVEQVRMRGRDRNALCLCGSGKKFKHCCGLTTSPR